MTDLEYRLHHAIRLAQSLRMFRIFKGRKPDPQTLAGISDQIESALGAAMEEIRELRAERRELQGRIALAMEAFDCCTDCVKTWLIGELDDEQKARVAEAQKRVSDAARAQAEDQS